MYFYDDINFKSDSKEPTDISRGHLAIGSKADSIPGYGCTQNLRPQEDTTRSEVVTTGPLHQTS